MQKREQAVSEPATRRKATPSPIPDLALADREQLRITLKPTQAPTTFNNWIARAMEHEGFPQPVRLGRRSCSWVVAEVKEWLAARPRKGAFLGRRTSAAPTDAA